jgi:hypothetical protein
MPASNQTKLNMIYFMVFRTMIGKSGIYQMLKKYYPLNQLQIQKHTDKAIYEIKKF